MPFAMTAMSPQRACRAEIWRPRVGPPVSRQLRIRLLRRVPRNRCRHTLRVSLFGS
jgi:hypothetical protein